jgi:hypothetical protein
MSISSFLDYLIFTLKIIAPQVLRTIPGFENDPELIANSCTNLVAEKQNACKS